MQQKAHGVNKIVQTTQIIINKNPMIQVLIGVVLAVKAPGEQKKLTLVVVIKIKEVILGVKILNLKFKPVEVGV